MKTIPRFRSESSERRTAIPSRFIADLAITRLGKSNGEKYRTLPREKLLLRGRIVKSLIVAAEYRYEAPACRATN